MKRFSLRLITFSLMLLPLSAAEFRQWKDTKGQVIEAKLLKVNGDGTIRIERKDGWVGNVPLELLSEEDRTYAKTAKNRRTRRGGQGA
ncbi:MAG: hypothetical protein HC845_04855 [Akkermansiaceae bacterium]|nr:hypothetical protein [Akkermansiaceae bacterium]